MGCAGGTAFSTACPSTVAFEGARVGKEGFFEGVVETMLTVEGLCQEVRLRDVALLAEYHVDSPARVQDQDL